MNEPDNFEKPGITSGGGRGKATMLFLGIGMALVFEVAAAVAVGFYIGSWVDRKLGVAPFGMILGLILFLGSSIAHAVITLKRAQANFEENG